MPYEIRRDSSCPTSKPFGVFDDKGRKYGCHESREAARKQQGALYAAEDVRKEEEGHFARLMAEFRRMFWQPVDSDLDFYDPEISPRFLALEIPALADDPTATIPPEDPPVNAADLFKEQHKRIGGVDFPAQDFAVVRDMQRPETWGILLAEQSPGNYTLASLKRAAAMLTPDSAAFKAMQLEPSEITTAKTRVRAEFAKLGIRQNLPASIAKELSDVPTLMTEGDRLRWFVVYSNNTLDNDYPPDILTARAHKAYAHLVKTGAVPPPQLWIWHLPNTRLGVADHVGTFEEGDVVLAYATGLADIGQEERLRKALALGFDHISHGAPGASVLRSNEDDRLIEFYASSEISLLPAERAANKLTTLLVKGETMPLTTEQRAALEQLYNDSELATIESALAEMAVEAGSRERKEVNEPPAAALEPETPAPDYVSRAEVEQLLGELANQFTQIRAELASFQKAATPPPQEMTPPASLGDMFNQLLATQPDTRLRENAPLAKAGPEETEAPVKSVTGIPFLDSLIQG